MSDALDAPEQVPLSRRSSTLIPFWTEERIQILRDLWGKRTSSEIAAVIGATSRSMVIGKAYRLGLSEVGSLPRFVKSKADLQTELSQSPRNVRRRWRTANPDAPAPDLASTRVLGNMMQRLANGEPLRAAEKPLPAYVTMPRSSKFQCTIFDLTNETCRFPVGGATGYQQMFCGVPRADLAGRQPYCGECSALAYAAPKNTWRRPDRAIGGILAPIASPVHPQTDF